MNNIIEVNEEEKEELFKIAREGKFLNEGAEGSSYLSKNEFGELEAIKINDKEVRYKLENVMLDSTINLKSFAFPKKVYMHEGKVVAYTARYYMDYLKPGKNDCKPFIINADMFCDSLSRFIDDMRLLSSFGVYINDLTYNLLFDNYNLVAIDTLSYEVRDYDTFLDNLNTLKSDLKELFKYKSEVVLDKEINFDKKIDDLLRMKKSSFEKIYVKH